MASGNALAAALTRPSNALTMSRPASQTLTPVVRRPTVIASASPMAINTSSASVLRQTRQAYEHMSWTYFRDIGICWYACVDSETEIMTRAGWSTHETVSEGDEVLTYNTETGLSEWQPVQAMNRFDVMEETLTLMEGRGHSSLTTKNHRWPIQQRIMSSNRSGTYRPAALKFRWRTTEELNTQDWLITGAPHAGLPETPKWTDAFVELIAWFWTEGHIPKREREEWAPGAEISQSIGHNPANVARIRACLTACFGVGRDGEGMRQARRLREPAWRESFDSRGKTMAMFRLNSRAAAELLTVAPNKVVQAWFVNELTRAQLELFLAVSLIADGSSARHIAQRSRERLEGFERACILTGRAVHIYYQPSHDMWDLHISTKTIIGPKCAEVVSQRSGRESFIIKDVPYTGTIWCPTTTNGTWLARRRGTVYYTGNSMFKANAISGVKIFPAEIASPGNDPIPVDDINSLQQVTLDDLSAGYSGLALGHGPMLAALTLHDAVPGKCFWRSRKDPDTGENIHEILSTEELQEGGSTGFQVRREPSAMPVPVDLDDLLTQMWTPDPAFKGLATSPMVAQGDTLQELWLLIQSGIASAKSRLASSGILTIPDELDLEGTVGPDGEPTKFEDEMLQAAKTAIKTPGSPASWFPVVIKGKSDYLKPEFLRWIPLFKDMPKDTREQITELRSRFAHDYDLPTELVTGLGDMTHWNAWIIDSMTWPHLRPICERILANLAISVYQPFLIAGGMDPRDARRQVIWYDESTVVAKPDRSGAATTGYQAGIVNPQAWLRSNGFDPELDYPSEEERARMFGERWGDPGLASVGSPPEIWAKATGRIATRVTETEKGVPGEGPVAENAPTGPQPGPPNPAPTPGPPAPSPGPPTPTGVPATPVVAASGNGNGHRTARDDLATSAYRTTPVKPRDTKLERKRAKLKALGRKLGAVDRSLLLRISVLADERLHAVVKTAGNKLRSAAQGRPLLASSIRGIEPLYVPRMLGPANAHQLGLDETLLIDQAARSFANKATPWLSDAQQAVIERIAAATDQDPEELAAQVADGGPVWLEAATEVLTAGFMREAGRFLFDPSSPSGPGEVSDIIAPRGAIRDALALAGGGDPNDTPTPGMGWGPMARDALGEGGAIVDGWTWSYNDTARTTFPGHLALDQIEFTSWEDDQLVTQSEDSWIGDFYAPGDHDGCGCSAEPSILAIEDAGASAELVGAEA